MNASNRRNRTSLRAGRPGSAPLAACVALAVVLAVTITVSAQQPAGAPVPDNAAAAPAAADAKGAATFARVCSTCHDGARILSIRRSKSQWTEVIEKMMERGAQVSDDDFTEVMDYLLRHYGRINVNKAEAEDLAIVAGLSKKDADAIVRHRDAQGDFPDFDALVKVPEIDIAKLNQAREAITF